MNVQFLSPSVIVHTSALSVHPAPGEKVAPYVHEARLVVSTNVQLPAAAVRAVASMANVPSSTTVPLPLIRLLPVSARANLSEPVPASTSVPPLTVVSPV